MIFVDNITNNTGNIASSTSKNAQQDIKLDALQTAVDNLNAAVASLQTSVVNLNSAIDNKYTEALSEAGNMLDEAINGLESTMALGITTGQVVATDVYGSVGHLNSISSSSINTGSISAQSTNVTTENIGTSTIESLTVSDIATLASATVQYLTAVNAAITNFDITNLTADELEADAADIGNIAAQVATISRINASLITVSDQGNWREPIGDVDNTELLKLTIPAYSGVTNLVTENDELNVSILNNNFVTFNQNADYPLYRVEFEAALNVADSYSTLNLDQEEYDLSVVEDFAAIEFIYDGTVYKYNKSDFVDTIDVDDNLSMTYFNNTIRFITTNDTTLTDILIYDSSYSGDNNVVLYLKDNITYKVIHLGDSSYPVSYSEIVDRTYYRNNVNKRSGAFIADVARNPNENPDLNVQIVQALPQDLLANTIYIVIDDSAYYSEDGTQPAKMGASITQVATNTSNITSIQNSIGQPNGIASLDSAGRIPYSQLPESAMEYIGTWDASTNTPELKDGTGTNGDFYVVSAAGTVNLGTTANPRNVSFYVNDRVIYDGSTHLWSRLPAGEVRSVNGHSGDVTLTKSDVGLGDVANTGDSATPVSGGTTKFTTGGAYTELNKKVDKTTTVNGHALSSNVTLTASDVGAVTSTDITNAINALDVTDTAVSGQYVSAVSEVNGVIAVTRANLPTSDVTGVKGNSESTYRTGNVNLTAANIGAVDVTDVPSGNINWASVLV